MPTTGKTSMAGSLKSMKSLREFGSMRRFDPFPEKKGDGYPKRTADPFDDSGRIHPSRDKGGIPFGNPNNVEIQ